MNNLEQTIVNCAIYKLAQLNREYTEKMALDKATIARARGNAYANMAGGLDQSRLPSERRVSPSKFYRSIGSRIRNNLDLPLPRPEWDPTADEFAANILSNVSPELISAAMSDRIRQAGAPPALQDAMNKARQLAPKDFKLENQINNSNIEQNTIDAILRDLHEEGLDRSKWQKFKDIMNTKLW